VPIFQINPRPVGRLGLGSGPHIVGRLGSGMRVSASFQIIPRSVGRLGLGLGSEPHVLGRRVRNAGSDNSPPRGSVRVRARVRTPRRGVISGGIFGSGVVSGELSPG